MLPNAASVVKKSIANVLGRETVIEDRAMMTATATTRTVRMLAATVPAKVTTKSLMSARVNEAQNDVLVSYSASPGSCCA